MKWVVLWRSHWRAANASRAAAALATRIRRLKDGQRSLGATGGVIECTPCPRHLLRSSCCAAGLKEDLIRTFDTQLRARDDQISVMDIELNACYQRLGEN